MRMPCRGRKVMVACSGTGGLSSKTIFQCRPIVAVSKIASIHANASPMQDRAPPPNGK
jgi:hypothetical protein